MAEDLSGKRVFLVNPPSVIVDDLIHAILAAEYEIYEIKDARRALRVFQKFPGSIVFVNIDSELSEAEWEAYVRRLLNEKTFSDIRVGVLSYNPEPALIEKYLMGIGVQCGFVKLKLGVQESTKIMLAALEANEARGRRRYVRARTAEDRKTSFNVEILGQRYDGRILDISSVGMAVRFEQPVTIAAKSLLPSIQLRLRATLVRVDGVLLGQRDDDKSIHIVLFRHEPDSKARFQIREYVHRSLQDYIDRFMGE